MWRPPANGPKLVRFLRIVLAVLLAGCLGPPPEFTGGGLFDRPERVALDSSGLLVAGRPFLVKGVNYEPVGANGTARDWAGWEPKGDLLLMKRVGFNTVRVREPPEPALSDLLADAARLDLKVVVVLPGPRDAASIGPDEARAIERDLRAVLARHAGHPAILAWEIGAGWDAQATGDPGPWIGHLDRLAAIAHREDPRHPTLTSVTDPRSAAAVRAGAPSVDVLGLRGFGQNESAWESIWAAGNAAGRPVLLTEFGADAWDDRGRKEDGGSQADGILAAWERIRANHRAGANVAAGGVLAAWADRSDLDDTPGPSARAGEPDEEWLGLRGAGSGGPGPLRHAAQRLAGLWRADADATPPSILDVRLATEADRIRVAADVVTYADRNATVEILFRSATGAWSTAPMAPTANASWEAALAPTELLYVRVRATDEAGLSRTTPSAALREASSVAWAAILAIAVAAGVGRRG